MQLYQKFWIWDDAILSRLDIMIDSLPDFRKKQVLSYRFDRDRALCAESYLMLQELLRENYKLEGNPVFGYLSKGKPYLIDHEEIHFSISHCRKAILCVVSDKEVGCDVEEIFQENDMGLVRACCNDDEVRDISSSPSPNIEFARLWTMKEAYLKFTGEGISDGITDILSESRSNCGFRTGIDSNNGVVHTIAFQKEC